MNEKVALMEGLLELLAYLFGMSTTHVADILTSQGIRSWSDFVRQVKQGYR